MKDDKEKDNKSLACFGQIIIALIIIAIIYGLGDFLKSNKEFSIILFVLISIWFGWKLLKK
ncbi:hypothetical protein [Dysgonomonas sp. Marseille-P4361]|uniref:hypothetical protein n=1 Tax=Dysgonomonas sp. Marseille-P4361 TaxID=2161820 RepID=UPI000D55E5F7|nr:hypothetical protein [Dysgonomonas sp. Marseille-P4361]